MIPKPDQWGPWAAGITDAERIARTRALRAIVRLLTGQRGADLDLALASAEHDESQLEPALEALNRLAAIDRRKVLGSYAGLIRPIPPARGTKHLRSSFIRVTPRPPSKVIPGVPPRRVRAIPRA